jgi:hypothetical protein
LPISSFHDVIALLYLITQVLMIQKVFIEQSEFLSMVERQPQRPEFWKGCVELHISFYYILYHICKRIITVSSQ